MQPYLANFTGHGGPFHLLDIPHDDPEDAGSFPPPMIFDAHLDLAMNAIEWNRDLTRSIADVRGYEADLHDRPGRRRGTVSLPEMRRAGIGLCVATQLARIDHQAFSPLPAWRSQAQAWAMTQAQLAW